MKCRKLYNTVTMKKAIISITAALSLLLIGSGLFVMNADSTPNVAPVATVQPVQKPQPPTVDELLRLVNEERAKVGVAPLVIDARLNQSAQKKADDMVKNNYFAHVSPVDGRHGYEYAQDAAPECLQTSENITDNTRKEDNTSAQAIHTWTHSKQHRLAIQNPGYALTGFGVSNTKIVEHFCAAR